MTRPYIHNHNYRDRAREKIMMIFDVLKNAGNLMINVSYLQKVVPLIVIMCQTKCLGDTISWRGRKTKCRGDNIY